MRPFALPEKVRNRVFFLVLTLVALGSLEVVSRFFWMVRYRASFLDRTLHAFYGELKHVAEVEIRHDDGNFDVLLLGGSVMHSSFGPIDTRLKDSLESQLNKPCRIFNLATPSHSSRDSHTKYRHLADKRFDLVLVYHAINDLRANNCPPSLFRRDYSHYGWYDAINLLASHPENTVLVSPYTLNYVGRQLWQRLGMRASIPQDNAVAAWAHYGRDIKTVEAFKENMSGIAAIAAERGEDLVLMDYAYYIPPHYSPNAFTAKRLDYGKHITPIEVFGLPENVEKGLQLHNAVLAQVAAAHPAVIYLNQNANIPKSGLYFDDICHLTARGCKRFVENIVAQITVVDFGSSAERRRRLSE